VETIAASDLNVTYLIGDLYEAMGDDKATIVTAMVARAQAYVDAYSGSQTGTLIDNAVETLAAMYILQRMIAGSNSTNRINIGAITIGEKEISVQVEELRKQFDDQMKMVGRGSSGRFTLTNPLQIV